MMVIASVERFIYVESGDGFYAVAVVPRISSRIITASAREYMVLVVHSLTSRWMCRVGNFGIND